MFKENKIYEYLSTCTCILWVRFTVSSRQLETESTRLKKSLIITLANLWRRQLTDDVLILHFESRLLTMKTQFFCLLKTQCMRRLYIIYACLCKNNCYWMRMWKTEKDRERNTENVMGVSDNWILCSWTQD